MSSRLYEYNTIVSDFPRFLEIKHMCKQWIPGSLFHSPLGMKLSEVAHSLNSNYGHCQDQQSYRSLIHNRNGQNKIMLPHPCHALPHSTYIHISIKFGQSK